MGTSNFYKENANLYYVVLMNEDEWDNEMDLEWISNELQENGFDLNNSNSHSDILGTKTETFSQSDMNFYISIQAKINSGYYQGANLDWNVVVGSDYYSIDSYTQSPKEEITDFIMDTFQYEFDSRIDSETFFKITDKIDSIIEELVSQTETLFGSLSTYKLTRLGTFSNGASVYSEVD